MGNTDRIIVDPEFKRLIPALSPDERAQLETNLKNEGCRDSLIVWKGQKILLDGHNRFELCQAHGLKFEVDEIDLADRNQAQDWICNNQLGRRNLTPEAAAYLRGLRYNNAKEAHGGDRRSSSQSGDLKTAEKLAEQYKLSPRTIERDGEFADAVNALSETLGDEIRKTILSRDARLNKTDVVALAQMPEAEQIAIVNEINTGKAEGLRDARRNLNIERRDALKAESKMMEIPKGTYRCIVIDPPWEMEKIERDCRPNQTGFDYPTMSEDELKAFDLPSLAADGCHLFLWATHKHLPMAFRLAEHWGFSYICTMVWRKSGGFQPCGLPQFNCEFVLLCRRGGLPFETTKAFFTCFDGARREHSRKPDEFYEVVKRVSPGPRIDVFSREKRDGFEQFGNETAKFEEGEA